ncbi:hypothetical protein BKA64DRAFT_447137 [Cadophora sp. MPI-SDFR-AT-0126]|nr:hypothetical protein BKA64DRAFT_447137 [Leotiomycetes sp. MPI-SDFR-AT-0126]
MDFHRLISGPPPARDQLSTLPSELKQRLLDFVDFKDHLNIRLVSRVWSIAGFKRTWNHGLVLRPNRNHVNKLIEVSRRPWLRERIRKIVFSVDDVDYLVVRHWMWYSSDPVLKQYTSDVAKFNNDVHRIFARSSSSVEEESLRRQDVSINLGDDDDDFCNATLLARTLAVMPNIKTIHVEFGEYPFQDLSLASLWNTMPKRDYIAGLRSTLQDQSLAVKFYSSILMGANAASLTFANLRMDRMPMLCFVPPDEAHILSPLNHLTTMISSVRHVQDLAIQFSGCYLDYTHTETHTIPRNIALFLGSMPLRSLTLGWGDAFDERDTNDVPRLLCLSAPFYDLTFPYLTTLRISHIAQATYMTPMLYQFLCRHSSALRRLHINSAVGPSDWRAYHARECRCVWKQSLLQMRGSLRLEKLELLLPRDDGLAIYDNEWEEIEGRENSDAKELERFVLGSRDKSCMPSLGHIKELCPLERFGQDIATELVQEQWAWTQDMDPYEDWWFEWHKNTPTT